MANLIDTGALKRDHPMEAVASRYGIELRRSGRALVGRCPFHDDRGRPNLHIYPDQERWRCYRCNLGGDAIEFVERMERVGFREAVDRLAGGRALAPTSQAAGALRVPVPSAPQPVRPAARRAMGPPPLGPAERACLAAAAELYQNCLLSDARALAYVQGRGLDRTTLERCHVGYASGGELGPYLRWRRLPVQAAMRAGLLRPDGSELLAGRVVVSEVRGRETLWMVGRTIGPDSDAPKYLGLPGKKPLLGWEEASRSPTVCLTEGVFDYLALAAWDLPALALVGTHVRPEVVQELARFRRVYVLLDGDEAGQTATDALLEQLASTGVEGVRLTLPGVKDVAELATHPDGRAIFAAAALRAAHGTTGPVDLHPIRSPDEIRPEPAAA